jgi:hypothetical protein
MLLHILQWQPSRAQDPPRFVAPQLRTYNLVRRGQEKGGIEQLLLAPTTNRLHGELLVGIEMWSVSVVRPGL